MIENAAEMPPFQVPDVRPTLFFGKARIDMVSAAGEHRYWSTHCRHDRHGDCAATELAPGVPRRPAQCKICASPCICPCHEELQNPK